MRILHVTPYYEGAWAYGGIPRVVPRLAHGLVARGHEVTVLTTDACDAHRRLPRVAQADRGGVRLVVVRNLSNRAAYEQLFLPVGLGGALRRLLAEGFDVAHLHACRNLLVAAASRALGRAGVPYVLSPHGTAPRLERRLVWKALWDTVVDHHSLTGAARLVAVSAAERRQLQALAPGLPPVDVVENPLDDAELEDTPPRGVLRARLGLPFPELALFLGKLTPRKRLDLLLEAVRRLDRPTLGLVVAGNDMGDRRRLERLSASLGLADRVRFVGLLEGRARLEALADADVVAYPSRDEVFGLVPFEALGCGTPVVVSDDSGCGELVREVGGGRVVPSGDGAALAGALADILAAPEAARAEAARARAALATRFGRDAAAARLEGVYRSIIGGR